MLQVPKAQILGVLPDAVAADSTLYAELDPGDRIALFHGMASPMCSIRKAKCSEWKEYRTLFVMALMPFGENEARSILKRSGWRDGPSVDDVSLILVEVL